jgi:mono/diheme cytochrome c family protein
MDGIARACAIRLARGLAAATLLGLGCATGENATGTGPAPAPTGEVAEAPAARAQSVESGEQAFVRYCAACHGVSGAGDGPSAAALREPPADLRRIAARRNGVFPRAAVQRMIDGRDPVVAHGPRDMPIWGRDFALDRTPGLAREGQVRGQIRLVLDYLETIQVAE